MTGLICARCGREFEPDTDHVTVDAEYRRINDRNEVDLFEFHEECWLRETEEWSDPA